MEQQNGHFHDDSLNSIAVCFCTTTAFWNGDMLPLQYIDDIYLIV